RFLAKAQRFHFRPLGICQYEAIHTDFESHLVTLKKYNSQQTPEQAAIGTSPPAARRYCTSMLEAV
ncbi:hypothetical protein, partial [Komagataeibacter europaeus]|uniref:hypothetical protein n=1 Tax=Komagataeibacter europaeus TaxID=33995 RepID=UPI001C70DB57